MCKAFIKKLIYVKRNVKKWTIRKADNRKRKMFNQQKCGTTKNREDSKHVVNG